MAHLLVSFIVMVFLLEFSSPFPDRRAKRHADGLFTSELSKIKNDVAMRSYLKSLLASKRSVSEIHFQDNFEDNETTSEKACYTWLYQNYLSESVSHLDAEEAAQESYKLICQPLGHLFQSLKEYFQLVNSPMGKL